MRLISVSDNGEERIGVVVGERATPAIALMNGGPKTMRDLLAGGSEMLEALSVAVERQADQIRQSGAPLDALTFLAPMPRPSKVVAIGLNYHAHAIEQNVQPPTEPLIFAKFPTSVIGSGAAITWDPALTAQVDYEAELAVVMGETARNVSEGAALGYVLRLHLRQRCHGPRPSIRRPTMGAWQEPRYVLPDRSLDRDA